MGKGRLLRVYYGYQELTAPPRFSFLTNFKGNDRELERSIHSIEKIIRQEGDWEELYPSPSSLKINNELINESFMNIWSSSAITRTYY